MIVNEKEVLVAWTIIHRSAEELRGGSVRWSPAICIVRFTEKSVTSRSSQGSGTTAKASPRWTLLRRLIECAGALAVRPPSSGPQATVRGDWRYAVTVRGFAELRRLRPNSPRGWPTSVPARR